MDWFIQVNNKCYRTLLFIIIIIQQVIHFEWFVKNVEKHFQMFGTHCTII